MMLLFFALAALLTFIQARFNGYDGLYSKYSAKTSTPMSIKQPLDHFNAYGSAATFNQRWYYDDEHWSGASNQGPFLFVVGGEGTNNGGFYGFVKDYASQVGGLLLTAEHRFYGESLPYTVTTDNYIHDSNHLGLLQVEQAMADYAKLMVHWQTSYFNCTECPVIIFGVSYPGELSVWLRLKYPQYFDMALASSGPIFYTSNSLVDPYCYYSVITNTTKKSVGSDACTNLVTKYYDSLMSSTNTQITSAIPLCSPLSNDKEKGLFELEAYLYEIWANYGMGNYPPTTSGLHSACQRMMSGDTSDGLKILSSLMQPFRNNNGCVDLSTKVPAGNDATIHCSDLTGCGTGYNGQSWDYQACAQNIEPFATNGQTDMFAVWDWNMTWLDDHCSTRFGIKASDRDQWMTREFGLDPVYFYNKLADYTSHIIFSNGMQDGWHCGGVMQNISDTLIAIPIENGAHGSDMGSSRSTDTSDIIAARNQERMILNGWLAKFKKQLAQYGRPS